MSGWGITSESQGIFAAKQFQIQEGLSVTVDYLLNIVKSNKTYVLSFRRKFMVYNIN